MDWNPMISFLGLSALAFSLCIPKGLSAQTWLTKKRVDIFVDTDVKNEVDDQNMIAYCMFSDLTDHCSQSW